MNKKAEAEAKKSLKILIVNYEHPPVGGGGGVSTMRLAKALVKKGHKVDILTTHFGDLKKTEIENGYTIYRVPVIGRTELKTASNLSMFTFPITSIAKGFELCFKKKYDVINSHFYAPSGPVGMVLSILFAIPNVLYLHGADVYDPSRIDKTPAGKGVLSFFLRVSAKLQNFVAKELACQSSDTKKNILQYIKPSKEVTIVPLPYESPQKPKPSRKELKMDEKNFYILAAGRVVKRKGYKYLVKALAQLPKNVHVNILSDGPEIESLEKLADSLGVLNRLKFVSKDHYVEYDEWYKYYASSDIFVLPSLHEGMGIAIQEAMDFGLPVVTTNHGGQVDLIKEDRNGNLVDPKNVEQLVSAIKRLYDSEKLRKEYGKNNLKDIKRYFADEVALEFLKVFRKSMR